MNVQNIAAQQPHTSQFRTAPNSAHAAVVPSDHAKLHGSRTQLVTATATRAIAPGCRRLLRISPRGVLFVLDKLAQTVLPVQAQIKTPKIGQCHQARVCRSRGCLPGWHLSGPAIDFDFPETGAAWLVQNATLRGEVARLEILDRTHRPTATLTACNTACAAWPALLHWLLLKEHNGNERWTKNARG